MTIYQVFTKEKVQYNVNAFYNMSRRYLYWLSTVMTLIANLSRRQCNPTLLCTAFRSNRFWCFHHAHAQSCRVWRRWKRPQTPHPDLYCLTPGTSEKSVLWNHTDHPTSTGSAGELERPAAQAQHTNCSSLSWGRTSPSIKFWTTWSGQLGSINGSGKGIYITQYPIPLQI